MHITTSVTVLYMPYSALSRVKKNVQTALYSLFCGRMSLYRGQGVSFWFDSSGTTMVVHAIMLRLHKGP